MGAENRTSRQLSRIWTSEGGRGCTVEKPLSPRRHSFNYSAISFRLGSTDDRHLKIWAGVQLKFSSHPRSRNFRFTRGKTIQPSPAKFQGWQFKNQIKIHLCILHGEIPVVMFER